MTETTMHKILRLGAISALLALVLVVWSFVTTRPIVVVAAMTVGQGLGTLSLLAFIIVVLADLRRSRVLPGRGRGAGEAAQQDDPDDRSGRAGDA